MKLNDLILSKDLKVIKKLRKTTARMFKNTNVGDVIRFTYEFIPEGTNRGIAYVSYLGLENLRTGETTGLSPNESRHYNDIFEYEEI